MKIHVNLDESYLSESELNIFFPIYWEHNNEFYPDKNWSDFGVELPGFWTNTIIELVEENYKESVFNFMDGPYRIQAKYDFGNRIVRLFPERTDEVWEASIDTVIKELILAIKKIYIELKQKNKLDKYQDSLERYLTILNRCLSKVEES